MKIYLLMIAVLFFSISSYTQTNATNLKQVKWLAGNWQGVYNNAPFYEAWRTVNDSLMVNFAIEVKGADTIVKESGFIRVTNKGIIHGGSATWTLDKLTDDEIVFRNDTMKYANRIIWSHAKNDHWLTEIHNPGGRIIKYDLVRVAWVGNVVERFIMKNQKRK